MIRFSANLGFLWTDRSLPDAVRAAKAAGFDAVECHWPYAIPPTCVKAALDESGLPILGLNTRRGDVASGDNGLSAIPGREPEAREATAEALTYAKALGAGAVHVMAGRAEGAAARRTFIGNLKAAAEAADQYGMTILIEPLNPHDAPGYFLRTTDQARNIIESVGAPNLKLMFDCYHVGRTEGDVVARLRNLLPLIHHVQFASVPDRGAPDHGEVDYRQVFDALAQAGWDRPLGAEYRPNGATEESLGWMSQFR